MAHGAEKYTQEIADFILERLAQGASLRSICKEGRLLSADFPTESAVRWWVVDDKDGFAAHYSRARDVGLDAMADQCLEVGATPVEGVRTKVSALTGTEEQRGDAIDRSRLHVDTLKWYLSKLAPKRYGDKINVEHSGAVVTIAQRMAEARKRSPK